MRISAKIKPNSKQEKIEDLGENNFVLHVKAPAKENKANAAAIELLSRYLKTPQSSVTILRGQKSKNKIFNIGI